MKKGRRINPSAPLPVGLVGCMILFQNTQFYKCLFQNLHTALHLLLCVRCHEGKAHQRVLWGTCGGDDRIDEDTILESYLGNEECLLDIVYIEGDDRTLGVANFKSLFLESLQ